MKKQLKTLWFALMVSLAASTALWASGGGVALQSANVDLSDKTAMQRGAGYFMNYCQGCHSLQYMRLNRLAKDLGISEEIAKQELMISGAKIGDPIPTSLPADQGKAWFGVTPPDLSLTARLRGDDWIYTYLMSFYKDPSAPSGWNNTVFENAAMPHVLSNLQGVQVLDHETHELKLVSKGSRSDDYDQIAYDITAFLSYVGEPIKAKRQKYGMFVMLFLVLFLMLALALKKDYWRDVH